MADIIKLDLTPKEAETLRDYVAGFLMAAPLDEGMAEAAKRRDMRLIHARLSTVLDKYESKKKLDAKDRFNRTWENNFKHD